MWVYPEIASMADLTRYHARVRGDALALWFGQNKISWRDFDRRAPLRVARRDGAQQRRCE